MMSFQTFIRSIFGIYKSIANSFIEGSPFGLNDRHMDSSPYHNSPSSHSPPETDSRTHRSSPSTTFSSSPHSKAANPVTSNSFILRTTQETGDALPSHLSRGVRYCCPVSPRELRDPINNFLDSPPTPISAISRSTQEADHALSIRFAALGGSASMPLRELRDSIEDFVDLEVENTIRSSATNPIPKPPPHKIPNSFNSRSIKPQSAFLTAGSTMDRNSSPFPPVSRVLAKKPPSASQKQAHPTYTYFRTGGEASIRGT
jgi:hypothetical protein